MSTTGPRERGLSQERRAAAELLWRTGSKPTQLTSRLVSSAAIPHRFASSPCSPRRAPTTCWTAARDGRLVGGRPSRLQRRRTRSRSVLLRKPRPTGLLHRAGAERLVDFDRTLKYARRMLEDIARYNLMIDRANARIRELKSGQQDGLSSTDRAGRRDRDRGGLVSRS